MSTRKASIKETGEELSQEEWERFDAAVEAEKARRPEAEPFEGGAAEQGPDEQPEDERARGKANSARRS